jgi:hypothetical protein
MILDENIKLNEWLQQKKGKIMKATFALTPILRNNNFSRKLRLLLYKSLIVGACNYGLELHYNMEHSKKLQPAMNLGLRMLKGAPRHASVLGIFRETGQTAVHTRAAIARLRLYRKIPELKTMLRQFYIHPDAVNTTRCGNTWMKKTARLYKQIENVQPENDTEGVKQKIIRFCENQYTWNANSMQCNTWRRYESDSMQLTAGWILGPSFESSRSIGAKYLLCARIGCLWTVKKAFVTEIVHIREDTPEDHLIRFKGTRCILCGDVIEDNSTEMAHLVVNCCFLQDKRMSLMWYINHFSEELTARMTLPSGRTMDNVELCIYKLLLGAKHGDSGQCRLAGLFSGGADGWYCGKGTLCSCF